MISGKISLSLFGRLPEKIDPKLIVFFNLDVYFIHRRLTLRQSFKKSTS